MEMYTLLATITVAFITAILGPIVVLWAKTKLESKDKKSSMDEAIELNKLVDEQIDLIMNELDCDRVWLAQFHNGGYFYPTGKSIQKFSIFYEKIMPEEESLIQVLQNIPVSLFPKTLAEIYKKGEIELANYDECENLLDLEMFFKSYGTKSLYMVGLYDLKEQLIGILSLHYNEEHKLDNSSWIFLRQKVGVIGTLLDKYLNKKQ
jgi:hypothetical protein